MQLWERVFNGIRKYYSYTESGMAKVIEEEHKHKYMNNLIDISDQIIAANPNFIDEVKKSETGCWMDQVYGTHTCAICDFIDDCPIKLQEDFEAFRREEAAQAAMAATVNLQHKAGDDPSGER